MLVDVARVVQYARPPYFARPLTAAVDTGNPCRTCHASAMLWARVKDGHDDSPTARGLCSPSLSTPFDRNFPAFNGMPMRVEGGSQMQTHVIELIQHLIVLLGR